MDCPGDAKPLDSHRKERCRVEWIANDKKPRFREWIVASATTAVPLILFVRGLFTHLEQPLPPAEALLYTVIFSCIVRWAMTGCWSSWSPARAIPHAPDWATLLLGTLFVAGITTSGSTATLCLVGILATIAIPLIHQFADRLASHASATQSSPASQHDDSRPQSALSSKDDSSQEVDVPSATESPNFAAPELHEPDSEEGLQQTVTRRLIGPETFLEGTLGFEMPPGETVHTLHVPIWPALSATPLVECDIEGFDGRVRVALSAPHGLRLEVRANDPSPLPRPGLVCFQAFDRTTPAAA